MLATLWVAVVLAAMAYVGWRAERGLTLQTDLMALLPLGGHDPAVRRANDLMAAAVGKHIMILVGDTARENARAAANRLEQALVRAGVMTSDRPPTPDTIRDVVAVYAAHRDGLLSRADRELLLQGRADEIVSRALAQILAPAAPVSGGQLASDPFFLLPAFLTALPSPAGRMRPDAGWLSVVDHGHMWVLISGELLGDPYALNFQDRFAQAYAGGLIAARAVAPDLSVLRMGAFFYAQAGAREAIREMSMIGTVSTVGVIVLIITVFRGIIPLLLCVSAIAIGILVSTAVCLLIFGNLHVIALLFGTTLIGAAVDYGLYYCAQRFSVRVAPADRLKHVIAGLTLGLLTSLVGYAAMALTPLTGLYQLAAFSVFGLAAAYLTVVLWFSRLDQLEAKPMGIWITRVTSLTSWLWTAPSFRGVRWGVVLSAVPVVVVGAQHLHALDDIRRQQSPSAELVAEQAELRKLTNLDGSPQFFVVSAIDTETALRLEEKLDDRLAHAVTAGDLANWASVARFVPSVARQQENAQLIQTKLMGSRLADYFAKLGLNGTPATPSADAPLTPAAFDAVSAAMLSNLVVSRRPGDTIHVVLLDGVVRPDALRPVAVGLDGVRFVDPVEDISNLFAVYRRQALILFALSVVFVFPLIGIRYGWRGGLIVTGAPVAAVVMTPLVLACMGEAISFFSVIALVLVFSVGVDYAVFFAEEGEHSEPATRYAVLLAASTAMLSNGLLAWSRVEAVHAFGIAMFVGLLLSYIAAPLATRISRERSRQKPWSA